MSKFSISSEKTILHTELFDVHASDIVKEHGEKVVWHIVKQKTLVFILALNEDKELYLIQQYRYSIGKVCTEIPAGYINENEKPLDAAKRELREETGLEARTWTLLGVRLAGGGVINGTYHYFLAEDIHEGEQDQDDTEDITVMRVKFADAVLMATNGEIDVANNCVGIFLLQQFLKKGISYKR